MRRPDQRPDLPNLHLRPGDRPGRLHLNQFLVDAEEPLLYHTGMRQLFPLVKEAIERVMPVQRLRWISFAHVEADNGVRAGSR